MNNAADIDNYRLARNRDLVMLTIRAMREGFRVLRSGGLCFGLGALTMLVTGCVLLARWLFGTE